MVAALAVASQQRSRDASIPFQSMIVISTIALLAPLSNFVLSLYFSLKAQQDELYEIDDGVRYLQQEGCINSTATSEETVSITWLAVKSTSIIASAVAALSAILYELFRRDPIVGKYVYDRKRLNEPDRTPPPLMLSRSLWTGHNDGDDNQAQGKKRLMCWKVKPAILELLFINLDHKYLRYSEAADNARKKREERGYYTCCRTGWYHKICFCSQRKLKNENNDDFFVDEDGYEYYPGHDYTLDEEVIAKRFETKWRKTIHDLFPDDGESFGTNMNAQVELDIPCDDDPEATLSVHESEGEGLISYPYRFVYLFMPPGFHVWGNAFAYINYFFCGPAFAKRFRILFGRTNEDVVESNYSDDYDDTISLTEPEEELLRCVGLDTYLLLRFARLGFDVTYYPFLVAVVAVLPVYYSAAPDSAKNRYLSLTLADIENGSRLIPVVVVFSVAYFFFILRRLWIEWEIFIQLRHSFLARGAQHFLNDANQQKYRKTCIVECVPDPLRTDVALLNEFDSLFPGQIERAEMLVETSKLEELVDKRKKLIKRLESADSLNRYKCWRNTNKPEEPKIRTGNLCSGEKQDEKVYYENKLLALNTMIDEEYSTIVENRGKHCKETRSHHEELRDEGRLNIDTLRLLFPSMLRTLFRSSNQFSSDTGIVEFKSLSAKQWAVQCNLSEEPYWMVTTDAPDPRDIIWANMCMELQTIDYRENIAQLVLLLGLAFWGAIVTLITFISNALYDSKPIGGFLINVGLTQGYLPALLISLVLLYVPTIFLWVAHDVIRFKSLSRVDEFVMKWSTGYRLVNVFFIFFNINLVDAVRCFNESPQTIWLELSNGIVRQSAFLMNLVILAAGQETMLQLLQWRSLLKHAVKRTWINVNSRSKRYLDALKEPHEFERAFMFGYYAPTLSYGLMIGMMFGFISPLMLGVCAIYFWIATKVNTHNALFVYRQPFESGGVMFYYWSRVTFITIYCSIVIFAGMLSFKSSFTIAVCFLAIMNLIVYLVDKEITKKFVVHSLQLPIKIAAEEVSLLSETSSTCDENLSFMYRNPILNQKTWQ